MPRPKPYRYRMTPVAPPDYTPDGMTRTGNQEVLTGVVQGMAASDLEERVARSLDKLEIPYQFRARITSQALGEQRLTRQFANIRGEVEIDMLCDRGGLITPIFVDGSISHFYTAWQADEDKEKTNATNAFGSQFGWKEAVRIPFWKLTDQDMTDQTIQGVFFA